MIDPALIRHAVPERLLTARLELHRDRVRDAEAVLASVLASRSELAPWLDWVTQDYDLREAVRGQRRASEYWSAGDSFQWRIWQRLASDVSDASDGGAPGPRFIGSIDLHSIDWDERTAELGYWLDRSAAGHGYVVEAGGVVLDVALTLLGFARLTIRCRPQNLRSIATAQRLGFVRAASQPDGIVVLELAGR
jgi:RimJ/RimL family protein N-acetyltransferase